MSQHHLTPAQETLHIHTSGKHTSHVDLEIHSQWQWIPDHPPCFLSTSSKLVHSATTSSPSWLTKHADRYKDTEHMFPPNNAELCLWQLTPRWMFVPCTHMQADKHNAVTASNNTNMNLMNITQAALTNHPVNDTGVISENLCCVKIHHSRATRSALPKVHVCTFGWCHVPSEKPTDTFFYWSTKEKEAVIAEDSGCAWASSSTTSGWRVLEILLITEKTS